VSSLQSLVGIFSYNGNVYVLRKHPGLTLLNEEEKGLEENGHRDGELDGDDDDN
jgi:hypothetical protein